MAGSRGGRDPLAVESGVALKALAPVAGAPMLARTLDAVGAASVDRIVVCGLDATALDDVVTAGRDLVVVPGDRTPGASAVRAIATLGLTPPILITTADHPLLRPDTIDGFCERAAASSADVAFGLVPAGLVAAAFPGIRRTTYRFRDGPFCGCNLYALLTRTGCEAPRIWAGIEANRKRPWRIVGALGWQTLLRFAFGRLASADLTDLVFARTGIRVRPIYLSDPAAGFDVDTTEQRRAAEAFLLRGTTR